MACKFAEPATTKLTLPDGDWLVVKTNLSVGEVRAHARLLEGIGPDGEKRARLPVSFAQIVTFLVDWNLKDKEGAAVPIELEVDRIAALDALRQEDYEPIRDAIEQHIRASMGGMKKKVPTKSGATKRSST